MAIENNILAKVDFPIYAIRVIGDRYFMVAGGGGQAKTGVPNAFEIYETVNVNGRLSAQFLHKEMVGGAIMNCVIGKSDKVFKSAIGIDENCLLFDIKYRLTDSKIPENINIRQRKNSFDKKLHSKANTSKKLMFEVTNTFSFQSDFSKDPFQKCICFSPDNSLLFTGGGDGNVRVWKHEHSNTKLLYDINISSKEIEDISCHPNGHQIATISKDGKCFLWKTENGKKIAKFTVEGHNKIEYKFKHCRFALVVDRAKQFHLFTTHVPLKHSKKPVNCFLTKWDLTKNVPLKCKETSSELISAFCCSEDGTYLGLGTIPGSVSVYIAFSLQKLYNLKEAHDIFVTGVEFLSNSHTAKRIANNDDFTLLSVSADQKIIFHQVPERGTISIIWLLFITIVIIYGIFYFISYFGL